MNKDTHANTDEKAKIQLYLIELSKVDFQSNITAILDLQSRINQKASYAKDQKKEFVSFDLIEVEVYVSQLLNIAQRLSGNYEMINNTNKMLVFTIRILEDQCAATLTPENS